MSDPRARGTPTPSESGGARREVNNASRTTNRIVDDKMKIGMPDWYYGDRNALDDWINQLDMYLKFNQVPDDNKTLFATTYLRGRAQHWIKPALTECLGDEADDETIALFNNFGMFKSKIRAIFGIANEGSIAVRMIQTLRQTASASDYAAKFQEHSQITG